MKRQTQIYLLLKSAHRRVEINSEEITFKNKNIGRLLINNKYPFALFKLENKKFDFDI